MSTGSMRSASPPPGGNVVSVMWFQPYWWLNFGLNIKEANVFGITSDEAAARLDVLAHQDREQLIGGGGVIEGDLAEHPHRRVHGGFPQLLGVHLAKTLVTLDAVFRVDPLARCPACLQQSVAFTVGVCELWLAALPLQFVQRRLRE